MDVRINSLVSFVHKLGLREHTCTLRMPTIPRSTAWLELISFTNKPILAFSLRRMFTYAVAKSNRQFCERSVRDWEKLNTTDVGNFTTHYKLGVNVEKVQLRKTVVIFTSRHLENGWEKFSLSTIQNFWDHEISLMYKRWGSQRPGSAP